ALLAAAFYLALSGAAVPTVRAWIMMSIFLIAVMLDRPAITMRNVALAALAILVVAPESLFDPSFEMSFAAVIGLVAFYEWLAGRKRQFLPDVSPAWRGVRWTGALVFGAGLTTLIAGTAVAPFAVYHFHRMTHFGLVANMIAAPLVSLLIMPMALLSLIAMPFGLEAWPLQAMVRHRADGGGSAMGRVLARRRLHPAADLRHRARHDRAWRVVAVSVANAHARAGSRHRGSGARSGARRPASGRPHRA
ncbi:ComEC/Rec2 family competence protein, partial [Methyloceanibacter marginalis]|uniref:ComEC/Rec2 family competence protein n=1 Tax=Methyloceanibacter marginalis TaxID=1774971 RepID=UPI00114CA210